MAASPKTARRICVCVVTLVKFFFSYNIEQYFLYNGLLYLALGALTRISEAYVHKYLCTRPSEVLLGGIGCSNCADLLLLCPKESMCWKQAVNLTTLKDAKLPSDKLYRERVEAALDTDCIRILEGADDPVSMMTGVMAERASTNNARPSTDCAAFHCEVLLQALLREENTDLPGGPGECTNVWGTKWDGDLTECTCKPETALMTLDISTSLQTLCGPMADSFTREDFYTTMLYSSKGRCYADGISSVILAKTTVGSYTNQAFRLKNCSYLTQRAFTAYEWFTLMEYESSLYAQGQSYTFNAPTSCVNDWCNAFNRTLTSTACNWASDPLLKRMTTADLEAVQRNCPGFGFDIENVCPKTGPGPAACASVPSANSTSSPNDGGAAARLLAVERLRETAALHQGLPEPCGHGGHGQGESCVSTDGRGLQGRAHLLHHPRALPLPRLPMPLLILSRDGSKDEEQRRLQAQSQAQTQVSGEVALPSSDSTRNEKLQEYSVSGWSQCVCLHQCTEGVRSRSVSCPPDMACKEPKPSTSEPCMCGHCADCKLEAMMLSLEFTYWFQGAACLLLAGAFLSIAHLEEDDFTETMGCGKRLIGCFCKVTPPLVRLGVYSSLAQLIVIDFSVIPNTGLQNDCPHSPQMQVMTIVGTGCWVIQLVSGIMVKRSHQVPAWMYNSTKEGWMTLLMFPFREIGP